MKIKCKEYFSYTMLACRSVNRPKHVVRGVLLIAQSLTTYASTQQLERQNIIARTRTWQQCSVTTSEDILTTKHGFNLGQNSPLSIDNNSGNSGWIRVSVPHALIGPQSLKLAHIWSDISWFPPQLFRYIPLDDLKRARETVLNATAPTSPPDDHSHLESPATYLLC